MQLTPFQTLLLKVNAQPHLNMSLYSPTPNAVSAIVAHLTCKTTMTKCIFTECNLLRETLSVIFKVPMSRRRVAAACSSAGGLKHHVVATLPASCAPVDL